LRAALHSEQPSADLNLISGEARFDWNVQDDGLYAREPLGSDFFRWTNGDASLTVPASFVTGDAQLAVYLASMTPSDTHVAIGLDDCTLFDGTVPGGAWTGTFPVSRCIGRSRKRSEYVVHIKSGITPAPPGDDRRLGVPVLAVRMGPPS
jgi:hypothetical protein